MTERDNSNQCPTIVGNFRCVLDAPHEGRECESFGRREGEEVRVPLGFHQGRPKPHVPYTCPRCGRTSAHPQDAEHGYCGACHAFTGDEWGPDHG